jgi:thioredoxin 1
MTSSLGTSSRMTTIDTHVPITLNSAEQQAAALYVDAERFVALVEQTPGLALVDFTADWCPPCRRLAPDIDALARERSGSLTVVKVDVDEQPGLASRFGVLSVPTLMFFRAGQMVERIVGVLPPAQLRAKVDELRGDELRV